LEAIIPASDAKTVEEALRGLSAEQRRQLTRLFGRVLENLEGG
jgi:hypothetical protein